MYPGSTPTWYTSPGTPLRHSGRTCRTAAQDGGREHAALRGRCAQRTVTDGTVTDPQSYRPSIINVILPPAWVGALRVMVGVDLC